MDVSWINLSIGLAFSFIASFLYLFDREWEFSAFVAVINFQVVTMQAIGVLA